MNAFTSFSELIFLLVKSEAYKDAWKPIHLVCVPAAPETKIKHPLISGGLWILRHRINVIMKSYKERPLDLNVPFGPVLNG